MPWESSSILSGTSSPSHKRNVGVLEVKMKHRLQSDQKAVAIGVINGGHQGEASKKARRHRKPGKLPRLAEMRKEEPRPGSFALEREQAMDAADLPSPTRSLIQKHVEYTKHEHERQVASLPPIAGAFKMRHAHTHATKGTASSTAAPRTQFPLAYQRNELPIMVDTKAGGNTLRWTQDLATIDYGKYFPLFLEGMREPTHPFQFMAREGALQLLEFGSQHPERVLDCLPRVVAALRALLDLREPRAMRDGLSILQSLAPIPGIGPALVPFYRQLLPVLNLFKNKRRNLGDTVDFQQNRAKEIGEAILETLEALERYGGPDAFINIKYMIPTYEGVVGGRRA